MTKFIAFLRGINVGGNKKVPMKDLVACFQNIGFSNIHTLLASGNVVFEGTDYLLSKVEESLDKTFGFAINTLIFPFQLILDIIESQPFKDFEQTPNIIFYISFFKEISKPSINIPYSTDDKSIQILKLSDNVIFWIVDKEKSGTIEGMKILEKQFGKQLTTRNFNTIKKLKKFS